MQKGFSLPFPSLPSPPPPPPSLNLLLYRKIKNNQKEKKKLFKLGQFPNSQCQFCTTVPCCTLMIHLILEFLTCKRWKTPENCFQVQEYRIVYFIMKLTGYLPKTPLKIKNIHIMLKACKARV